MYARDMIKYFGFLGVLGGEIGFTSTPPPHLLSWSKDPEKIRYAKEIPAQRWHVLISEPYGLDFRK
jgi:hypothetical protein